MAAPQFRSIQCLRGLAASAVALSHLFIIETKYTTGPTILPTIVQNGVAGVDLFFVISGFIITTVTTGSFRREGETSRFLLHRIIRIYPIYWFYFFLVLGIYVANPAMVNSNYGAPNLLTSFLLLPHANPPLLAVAWTLVYELFFYCMFAAGLRWLKEQQLIAALLIWAAITVIGVVTLRPTGEQPILNLVFSPYILEFLAGCLVAKAVPRVGRSIGAISLVSGVVLIGAGTLAVDAGVVPPLDGWRGVLIYGIGSAFLVAGCAGLERNGALRRIPPSLVRLGDASYSLYLSHVLTLSAVGRVWHHCFDSPSLINHLALLIVASSAAVAWGLLSHRFIEAPLLRFLRATMDRSMRIMPARTSHPA